MMDTLPTSARGAATSQTSPLGNSTDTVCGGCELSIESETGGVVVSFGDALWHVKCFRCAKCHERVTADTNLLLLSDGSPVCGSCSYNCNVCKLPILDEAIMTGDESYHASCFTCRSCSRQIQELVFAKTTNGIYCMACHNERVARSRRHAEAKKAKAKKEKERAERERERSEREKANLPATPLRPNGLSPNPSFSPSPSIAGTPGPSVFDTPPAPSARGTPATIPGLSQAPSGPGVLPLSTRRSSTQSIQKVLEDSQLFPTNHAPIGSASARSVTPSLNFESTSEDAFVSASSIRSSVKDRKETHPLPSPAESASLPRETKSRKSYDDGVRPLSHFLNMGNLTSSSSLTTAPLDQGLDVPPRATSRAEKRRSINPGLFLSNMSLPSSDSLPITSPIASSSINGRLSPNPASPLRGIFTDNQIAPGPISPSSDVQYFSPASSPVADAQFAASRSRSHSPVPASQSSPTLLVPLTPPSLSFISPSPDPTPSRSTASLDLNMVDPPSRNRSLPKSASQPGLTPDEGRTPRRSPSPNPRRAISPSPGRASPSPANGNTTQSRGHLQGLGSVSSVSYDSTKDLLDLVVEVTPETDDENANRAPIPPPKDRSRMVIDDYLTGDMSDIGDDDSGEAMLVSQTSRVLSAPALPPMRFSLSSADFAGLLSSVGDPSEQLRDLIRREAENGETGQPKSATSSVFDESAYLLPDGEPGASPTSPKTLSPPITTPTSAGTITDQKSSQFITSDSDATAVSLDTALPSPPSAESFGSSLEGYGKQTTGPLKFRQNGIKTDIERDRGNYFAHADSTTSSPGFYSATSPTTTTSAPLFKNQAAASSTTSLSSLSRPSLPRNESTNTTSSELVSRRLREALADANERGAVAVKLDREFVDAIVRSLDVSREKSVDLRGELDSMKRTSHQYMAGFSVAQSEYHKEVAARRDAEAEVTRLRVQLSGQAARLTAMSAEDRRRDMMEQMSKDLSANLHGLERDLSKLKVERDMTLAEVEELSYTTPGTPIAPENNGGLTRSLTTRFDNLKSQYRKDLEPLKQQREALIREINELKEARDIFLEETTALNARNEELAELNSQIARQIESGFSDVSMQNGDHSIPEEPSPAHNAMNAPKQGGAKGGLPMLFGKAKGGSAPPSNSPSFSSVNNSMTVIEEREESVRSIKGSAGKQDSSSEHIPAKKFKWFGVAGTGKSGWSSDKENKHKKLKAHNFQQQNVLRFARCDHCGDKMWGTQFRCTGCSIACHPRCLPQIQPGCQNNHPQRDELVLDIAPLQPSLFGRDLIEQVRSDSKLGYDQMIPVIVEKCIFAVENLAMDYEGIYRKTGGSSQSKAITQLFERGDYQSFDLTDQDSFNDISSVTSVLKTYFRSLPNPLLTFALHEQFVNAAGLKDPREKHTALIETVTKLPREHYMTLRFLMLHLYRVQQRSSENLMNARNLGVVFGPTLMRSSDSSKEFADMAGKALSIEFLIENAPEVFSDQ